MIRADASMAIGTGHMMRCLALAKAWQNAGGIATWLTAESIPALDQRLLREGIDHSRIEVAAGTVDDAEQAVDEARRRNAAWVVVDGYRFFPDYITRLKRAGLRVIFMDDDGRFDSYPTDVVLNQNISASVAMYGKREAYTRLLLGSEYVLLRPEFLAETPIHDVPTIGRKVLITMGGSDPENVSRKALLAMKLVKNDCEVRVVVGGGNPRGSELQALAGQLNLPVQIECRPENMAPIMRWANVAISAAGSTCWELAYMGVPSIVIALSSEQRGIAEGLSKAEIAVSLGWHANLSEERIADALCSLLIDQRRRLAMSERGRKLIDGRGAARVVQFLQNSL